MNIGLCRISLRLHGTRSLKQKRQITQSIVSRVGRKFNVAIAEIDDNDLWQRLTLGISCVSNHAAHANEVISKVVNYIDEMRGEAEVIDYDVEMVNAF